MITSTLKCASTFMNQLSARANEGRKEIKADGDMCWWSHSFFFAQMVSLFSFFGTRHVFYITSQVCVCEYEEGTLHCTVLLTHHAYTYTTMSSE